MIPDMDYSLIHHSPDGTGMFLVTLPGTPDRGSYMTEQEFKEWIVSSIGGGIIPKGDILSSNLPPADDTNKGWQYYCTDLNKYAISDGTAWIYFSNSPIVQTPDATDTGHALSNAVVTQCCNEVKANVQNNSQRITNIENALSGTVIQEHTDSTQKNVKTILSADELLPWAILKRVGARSTQFNQWFETSQSIPSQIVENDVTITPNSDGSITLNGTASADTAISLQNHLSSARFANSGHKVLMFSTSSKVFIYNGYHASDFTQGNRIYSNNSDTENVSALFLNIPNGNSFSNEKVYLGIFDLTAMSLDTLTASQFKALFPASYYPFNAGNIYDVPPLSFFIRGTNQWDEDFLAHYQWTTSGSKVSAENWNCSNSMYKCLPSTQYYFMINNKATFNVAIFWFDANGNYVDDNGLFSAGYRTSPANASYFALNIAISEYGGTTYNHDIMICLNSVTDKTYKSFIGQTIDTSFMAGKKYVNPNCYDYAENVYVNGILKRKNQTVVGSVDLGTLNWSFGHGRWVTMFSDYSFVSNNQVCNMTASKYVAASAAEVYESVSINTIAGEDGTLLSVYNGSDSITPTGILYYELATLPDPTYGDPIPNFPCEDGSTITAITPQTEIVNAIDVPSTIGYSTKIE